MMIAAALVSVVWASPPVMASVDDFRFSDFTAEYYLSRDAAGRSTLKTVERLTAEFPDTDQNHGIERLIPTTYDRHSVALHIDSVKKADGSDWNYTARSDSTGYLTLRIGDADRYVHGQQTYVITYTQRDVTKFFADTNSDEFYWDTNGTAWSQPFDRVEATVHVDEALLPALTGSLGCYRGNFGEANNCDLRRDGATFRVTEQGLGVNENITLAIGFRPGTFAAYEQPLLEKILLWWGMWQGVSAVPVIAIVGWLLVRANRRGQRASELGTIVPEYLPPKDTAVVQAARVLSAPRNVLTAQIIDLAVRHYLKIYEVKAKTTFSPAQYELEVARSLEDLSDDEKTFIFRLFSHQTAVGTRMKLADLKNDPTTMRSLTSVLTLHPEVDDKFGYFDKAETERTAFAAIGKKLLGAGALTLSLPIMASSIAAFFMAKTFVRITDKGLTLRRYLGGLKHYIAVAETERLRLLQSPEGAEKVGDRYQPDDTAKLVKLYERVLPYAILFGQEKKWNTQLSQYYTAADVQPSWYVGATPLQGAAFSSAMSSFAQSTVASSGATSSSSGGSSGGGFSGGGGGGGGGGGW